jgi:type II secretory pathway pseudopilin PulG
MLVVMALVAMAVGLVAPATLRGLDAARERGLSSDLEALLAGLPLRAFQNGLPLCIDAKQLRATLVDLPPDWRLKIKEVCLQYGPTGMAAGGEISMQAPGRDSVRWKVSLITGEVKRLP